VSIAVSPKNDPLAAQQNKAFPRKVRVPSRPLGEIQTNYKTFKKRFKGFVVLFDVY